MHYALVYSVCPAEFGRNDAFDFKGPPRVGGPSRFKNNRFSLECSSNGRIFGIARVITPCKLSSRLGSTCIVPNRLQVTGNLAIIRVPYRCPLFGLGPVRCGPQFVVVVVQVLQSAEAAAEPSSCWPERNWYHHHWHCWLVVSATRASHGRCTGRAGRYSWPP
jgi:hypothetical protein